MKWTEIKNNNELNSLILLLRKNEWECIFFTSFLLKNIDCLFSKKNTKIYILKNHSSQITGAVLFMKNGAMIPVFNSDYIQNIKTYIPNNFIMHNLNNIFSLIGTTKNIMQIKKNLNYPKKVINYHLMTDEEKMSQKKYFNKIDNLIIKKATIKDAKILFPLQEEYEKEEVLLESQTFNPLISYNQLKNSLKTQITYYAKIDNKIAAKAGTNAIGFDYIQIGGVYTYKKYRNIGIAKYLVKTLIDDIAKKNKKRCLFVKKNNPPAINLYEKSGFKIKSDFNIIYF